jgi:3-hydroxybutyryl-CoA dehydrogenase
VTGDSEFNQVAVIGAGTMGAGIAQVCAMAGHGVSVCDPAPQQLQRAREEIAASLAKLASKGQLLGTTPDDVLGGVRWVPSVGACAEGADVVIESVVEILEVKGSVLCEALAVARSDALLATNTSQLSITAIAAATGAAADRVVGLHFFNPAVLMRLVEIVRGLRTDDATIERARRFAASLNKEVVVCHKDSPGFLTSRVSAIVRLECLRMLEEGVGSAEDIDLALRLGLNFPIGPLELGDRNGLDTYLLTLESMSRTRGERFRPTVGLRNLVAAGRLGRKSGRGIFSYTNDGRRMKAGE